MTFSYSVWCTGERELYDLVSDPHQVRNLLAPLNAAGPFAAFDTRSEDGTPLVSLRLQRALNRLDALLLVLKTCSGTVCTNPYAALFPDLAAGEEVYRYAQVTHPRFDAYFSSLPRVRFAECALGFQSRLERPEWDDKLAFGAGLVGDSLRDSRFVVQV